VAAAATRQAQTRLIAALFLIAVVLAAAIAIAGYEIVHSSSDAQQRATQTGLDYSRNTMIWEKGPQVQSSAVVPMHSLPHALLSAPQSVQHDINVSDLIKQYGRNRLVDLVLLRGKFNTLPPGEGVDIYGQVVVLVDMKTRRVLLMTR
jgi:hypothetical protein